MSLPVPVTRIRFAMPFCVLILGTGRSLLDGGRGRGGRGGLPAGREDHEEVLAPVARWGPHLDEVAPLVACDAERGVESELSQLFVLVIDQPHFRAADLIVDLQLFNRDETLPRENSGFCYPPNSAR